MFLVTIFVAVTDCLSILVIFLSYIIHWVDLMQKHLSFELLFFILVLLKILSNLLGGVLASISNVSKIIIFRHSCKNPVRLSACCPRVGQVLMIHTNLFRRAQVSCRFVIALDYHRFFFEKQLY